MSRHNAPRVDGKSEGAGLGTDDTGCNILHVDIDAFFAAVEVREQPNLRGKPVIVAGGNRGIVLSATYEARALGVHAAMPVGQARRLAPKAVFLPPRHDAYSQVSTAVMAVLAQITPELEQVSIDEAYLDVSGAIRRLGAPTEIAKQIRQQVATEQKVTCSVGVAATKQAAKLASTRCKPDGLLVIPAEATVDYLHTLPIQALSGVGTQTLNRLNRFGLTTVAEVANTPTRVLQRVLGQAAGASLHAAAWGQDQRTVQPNRNEKSVGSEHTFTRDVRDEKAILNQLLALSEKTAARCREHELTGTTVVLKVRFADFRTVTRSHTRTEGTDVAQDIYRETTKLWTRLGAQGNAIRLVGVRLEGLQPVQKHTHQLALGERLIGRREAEQAIDRATRRFGTGIVQPATLLPPPNRPSATNPNP